MRGNLIGIIVATVVLAVGLLLQPPGMNRRLSGMVRLFTDAPQAWADWTGKVVRAATGSADRQSLSAEDMDDLRQELASARSEYAALQAQSSMMRRENVFLKSRLRIIYSPASFTLSLCHIVHRDPLKSYYDELLIDRGSADGLRVGQLVLSMSSSPSGDDVINRPRLVGILSEVSGQSSLVRLVTSRDFSMSCHIPSRGVSGLLMVRSPESESSALPQLLSGQGRSLVLACPQGSHLDSVCSGDEVYTSALGGGTESVGDILVGVVRERSSDQSGVPLFELERPPEMETLNYVLVALRSAPGGGDRR